MNELDLTVVECFMGIKWWKSVRKYRGTYELIYSELV